MERLERIIPKYTETTRGIKITVAPEPVTQQSDPTRGVFTFLYNIRIENLGVEAAQLMERHWLIESAGREIADVTGPGVVGVQPRIVPGGAFEYQSSAVIEDAVGSMRGSYVFRNDTGEFFEVVVPQFDLVFDLVLH